MSKNIDGKELEVIYQASNGSGYRIYRYKGVELPAVADRQELDRQIALADTNGMCEFDPCI